MAFIDVDDALDAQGDLWFVASQRHKIYNILAHPFAEMPELWLELTTMLEADTSPLVRSQALTDHLRDFACNLEQVAVAYQHHNGQLHITIEERTLC